jgi:hypothetical protein
MLFTHSGKNNELSLPWPIPASAPSAELYLKEEGTLCVRHGHYSLHVSEPPPGKVIPFSVTFLSSPNSKGNDNYCTLFVNSTKNSNLGKVIIYCVR